VSRPTAAVIGSGVAGLTAAYLLQRRYDVTLFEADARLGGHAHTHELVSSDGDTTFTHPHLSRTRLIGLPPGENVTLSAARHVSG
jgi:predicted NAD/FAD-binding protein